MESPNCGDYYGDDWCDDDREADPTSLAGHEGFHPNDDGTVTYISPTGGEHTYDPDEVFKDTDSDHPLF